MYRRRSPCLRNGRDGRERKRFVPSQMSAQPLPAKCGQLAPRLFRGGMMEIQWGWFVSGVLSAVAFRLVAWLIKESRAEREAYKRERLARLGHE